MAGNFVFPVVCVVSVCLVQLSVAQPPPQFFLGGPRPPMRSWGVPSEIYSSTEGPFRPTPAVLISGHGPPPPGSRPLGPVRHGGRPPFPLVVTSTPMPHPSDWPIQRARESRHFEYEVMPRLPKPPTLLRVGPFRGPPIPIPTQMTTTTLPPPGMVRVHPRDAIITTSPRPQERTDRPPPPFVVTGHPPTPTYATPSDADFQEGFRILRDLFVEDGGADIRNNLVGGSDVSFSGGYFPPLEGAPGNNSIGPHRPTQREPHVQITQAKEQGILIAGTPPKEESDEMKSSEEEQPTAPTKEDQIKQATDISYGPPHYPRGPPQHSSFMFSDPNEPTGTYNLYNTGFEAGPPPPFHTIGNSIIPPPPLPQRQPPPPPQEGRRAPPQNSPPRPKSPQESYGPPPPNSPQGSYGPPPPKPPQGSYGPPPQNGNSFRSGGRGPPSPGAPIPMPMMMMPLAPEQTGNQPPPSSEEVQRALGVLARFASKQAKSMGMSASPQMMLQMMQGGPDSAYGPPQPQKTEAQPSSTPGSTYGPPSQQPPNQSYGAPSQPPSTTPGTTPPQPTTQNNPGYLSVQVTAPPPPNGNSIEGSYGRYTTEPADAITVSASPEESSPFPSYGPPHIIQIGGDGGYQTSNVGGGGGYETSNSGGYEASSSGGWGSGGGWGSSGGGNPVDLIGVKVNALKTIGTAVTGGIKQVGALKAGILNAGLNVLGGLGHAKGNIANSLKIPIVSKQPKPVYGAPSTTSTSTSAPQYGPPQPQYGPPQQPQYGPPQGYSTGGGGWGSGGDDKGPGPIAVLVNAARGVVGGITGTIAASAKAGVGIGLSKNEFVKNHFVIKGQAFTDTVSKKIQNKNEYFQNVLKHVTSIFEAAKKKPQGGWSRR